MTGAAALLLQAATTGICAPGIYAPGGAAPIAERAAEKRKVANLAGAMFLSPFGAGKLKVKSVIPGAAAMVRLPERRPAFRFCFTPGPATTGYVGAAAGPTTPGDYRLIRLTVNGDQRELELAAVGGFSGGGASLSKSVVPVDVSVEGDGMYRVTPRVDLPPGEYGFLRVASERLASMRKKDVNERVTDFGVTGP